MTFCVRPHMVTTTVALLFFLPFQTNSHAQQTPQPAGQSTVRGRVVYSDGQPVKGVTVGAISNQSERATAVTNDRGEFQIGGLAAGKYYLVVHGPGVPMPSGFGMAIPLPLAAIPRPEDYPEIAPKHDEVVTVNGSDTKEVEIRIVRGGSITGKVMKPDGSPAADVPINLLSRETGASRYTSRFTTRTNQKGVYRIESVPPADYIVSATKEDKRLSVDFAARVMGAGQIVTFHPAAIHLADALMVRIDSARESAGINIILVERKALSLSGKLVKSRDGSPIEGASIILRSKDTDRTGPLVPGMGQRTTVTSGEGTWSFTNVAPGDYEVIALDRVESPSNAGAPARRMSPVPGRPPTLGPIASRARPEYAITAEQVSLVSSDVENLTLTMRGMGRIRGVVEMEDGEPLPRGTALFFEFSDIAGRPARPVPVRVESDGSFVLENVPAGERYITAAVPSGSDYYVVSASAGGSDLREGLSIVEDTEGSPVQVRLSRRLARVSGTIQSSSSAAVESALVLFIPVEPSKQRFRSSLTIFRVAANGSFGGVIPPGEYFVVARDRSQLPTLMTSGFMTTLTAAAVRVALLPDEQKTLQIRLNQP